MEQAGFEPGSRSPRFIFAPFGEVPGSSWPIFLPLLICK